ncbi:MAG: hypothetical protein QXT53_03820 [Ignisphaera sp.]
MSKTKSVDIAVEKYCFQPYETPLFVLYVLKKCGESLEALEEEEVAYKFVENDETFESWINSKLEEDFREGVVKATINYYDKIYSTIFFKELKTDPSYFIIPVPYLARLLKIVVLKDIGEGETSIKEDDYSSGFAIDFSHDNLYAFFNPIKILDSFTGLIIVTSMGVEHIKSNDLVKIFESTAKRKKKSRTRKRKRRARKRKSKKG